MVSYLRVHATANVVELFVKILVVLRTTQFLTEGCVVTELSIKSMWVICLSSRLLVIEGPIDSLLCLQSLNIDRREQQYFNAIHRNPSALQFDLYQNQKRAGMHFCFLHETSQQLFNRQQRSNAICV
ncbi:hypothetical protein TNCV_92001 [Trichonephila clavipes]|nr:hypothetical protein TNCV_92001 [Trichonephila clavipes]